MAQFRTKARAIDLLGKGQIADLPTAISELWKNGYDAYAKKLSCDLYTEGYSDVDSTIFSLSDDGFGMSREDILNKWIVLGTDSKSRGKSYFTEEQRFGLAMRTPMGEKGIGRLSVAYLGSPMLMLTKKKGESCQMVLMDWRILENYNLFVDNVNIPLYEFSDMDQFRSGFELMKLDFIDNFAEENLNAWEEQKDLQDKIEQSVTFLKIPSVIEREIEKVYLDLESHGTRFIIFEPDEQLLELTQYNPNDPGNNTLLELKRSLSGIYNSFLKQEPDFSTAFNIRKKTGDYNIIQDFFDYDDFNKADNYIKGHFDEDGMFEGIVRVYKETFPYKFRPIRVPGKTPYGPFDLELGTIEGRLRTSLLSPDEYDALNDKTEKFGGLYIYRDKFRVLPYGRTDYDFLKFEERRSKSAGYYFFSHRNMFGYIAISREANPSLTDKAGREGLIENKAYREFKTNLIDFFIDIAKTYFRTTGEKGELMTSHFAQLKEIEKRNDKILEAEKKKSKLTKAKFTADLKNNETKILQLQQEINVLYGQMKLKAESLETTYSEYQELASKLASKKEEIRALKLKKPARVKLSELQEKRFATYNQSISAASKSIEDCDYEISRVRHKFDVANLKKDYENNFVSALREISMLVGQYDKRSSIAFDTIHSKFIDERRNYGEDFKDEVAHSVTVLNTKEEYEQAIEMVASIRDSILEKIDMRYSPFVNHVESLNFDIDDDVLVGWYKEQHKKLEERLESTDELAQLGISAEIIDHELNVLQSQMASSIKYLSDYAQSHTEITDQFNQLKVAFEHMEANYKMLQPLYRMSRRQKRTFTGKDLTKSLKLFFASKLKDLNVELKSSESFDEYSFFTFESVIYSTFINVINNALYWLIPVCDRKIYIEYNADSDEILIMNNGEKMADSMLEDIFTLFYTRKSNGRGIGLYLARKSLNSIGFDIVAKNEREYNKLNGACFVIRRYNK